MTEIELRATATQATQKRFEGKAFDWSKAATCIHLLRFHAAQMGHKMPVVPRFRTALGATKILKGMGHDDLPSLMNDYFMPIPPAFARTGDIVAGEGVDGFHSMMIRGSATKFLGWHEDAEGCTIIDVDISKLTGAWRL